MEQSLRSLPFTFAKQNGILLQDGEVPTILHQGPLTGSLTVFRNDFSDFIYLTDLGYGREVLDVILQVFR